MFLLCRRVSKWQRDGLHFVYEVCALIRKCVICEHMINRWCLWVSHIEKLHAHTHSTILMREHVMQSGLIGNLTSLTGSLTSPRLFLWGGIGQDEKPHISLASLNTFWSLLGFCCDYTPVCMYAWRTTLRFSSDWFLLVSVLIPSLANLQWRPL